MTAPTTASTLRVPDADLHYELRGSGRFVVLVGAPMDARPFTALAELLATDHLVLTTDPRGINRSRLDDPDTDATLDRRADDLARLIRHVDAGPAVVLGSSGGAVSALALTQAHPELVHTVIAHEPPLNELLPDRDELRAGMDEVVALHLGGDPRGAFRLFLKLGNLYIPDPVIEQILSDDRPAQDVADDRFQHAHMLRPTVRFEPDIAALKAASSRIVIGIGEASAGQLCDRTSRTLSGLLGIEPTMFPGGHIGFVENPVAFAARLRTVLA
ncbi:MAG TPA: alpha/beta hydrolase [Pseudonocardiaceae bacterium]|jgi:pimeloyl-ACP methyl ester carboxylesterase|nr:alpha/beta hydrolase [Pseudonocardiaceae bacterium]